MSAASGGASGADEPDGIVGERGKASVRQGASVQGRLQTGLALVVIASLVGGFLYWWYAGVAARSSPDPKPARVKGSEGEYVLPALGWVDRVPALPFTGQAEPAVVKTTDGATPEAGVPALGGAGSGDDLPMSERAARADGRGRPAGRAGAGGRRGDRNSLYKSGGTRPAGNSGAPDRRLVAPVMWRRQSDGSSGFSRAIGSPGGAGSGLGVMDLDTTGNAGSVSLPSSRDSQGGGDLTQALRATGTPPARAAQLPDPGAWLPKGAFLDCTLETAIDSTLPGFATCVTAIDVYGADGVRVLMARGTRLVGEVRTSTRVTQKRVFVLWHEARTPEGVIVPLSSPGTDALGRSGLAGEVDRHFMARFGAAFLVSTIDAAVRRAATSGRGNGSDIVIDPRASSDVAAEILRDTIRIPPTISVAPGSRVQVLVARNVDFRGVVEPAP